jgi:hypothetical protein
MYESKMTVTALNVTRNLGATATTEQQVACLPDDERVHDHCQFK